MTPEVPPKDEMKELQSKIDKELRSLSEINKEIDNRVLQLKLPPKLLPPKLPPKLIPKQDLHFVTMNPGKAIEKNTLDHGQANERKAAIEKNTLDPGQANERKATLTTVKQTTVQPREQGARMITKAKEFLEKASKEKDKEAEKKLEWDKMCNTPGPGFQQNQIIPAYVTFCFICRTYKRKIHYCIGIGKYINIDDKNLITLEGESAAEVEGISSQTKKECHFFITRKDMRTEMFNRVSEDKREAFNKREAEKKSPEEKLAMELATASHEIFLRKISRL